MDRLLLLEHPWTLILMIAVQALGMTGIVLARLSIKSQRAGLLQTLYFLSLFVVAMVAFLGLHVQNPWWLVTGTTFAAMVVGAAADFRPPADARRSS